MANKPKKQNVPQTKKWKYHSAWSFKTVHIYLYTRQVSGLTVVRETTTNRTNNGYGIGKTKIIYGIKYHKKKTYKTMADLVLAIKEMIRSKRSYIYKS